MFDIGFWEIFLIGIVALFVVGPERLPELARKAGLYYARLRRFASNIKADIDREMGAGNLQELKEVTDQLKQAHRDLDSAGQKILQAAPNRRLDDALINSADQTPSSSETIEPVKSAAEEDGLPSRNEPSVTSLK
jgi:Tat protein translocase TatB subunit